MKFKKLAFYVLIAIMVIAVSGIAFAAEKKGELSSDELTQLANQFPNSVLSVADRIKELEWFMKASAPYRGAKIKSTAESIATHTWESEVLAKAFEKLTGIQVSHDIIDEGSLVERIYTQTASKRTIYDIYVNDTDLVGTHLRKKDVVVLSDYMKGEGKAVTNPYLDLADWMNIEGGQDYDGNLLQLPDQQFANLYTFRYDWFTSPKYMKMFKEKYGYELGVPLTWSAYEDLAKFWSNDVGTIDGVKIYGSSDYGKRSPDLGWRFSDSWFGIAGVPDKGLPQGIPVDDWGLRAENKIPVGFSVSRGGALNSPAAIHAVQKYVDWINDYSPSYCTGLGCYEMADTFAKGIIAQQMWMYVAFLANPGYKTPGSPVVYDDGMPKWRVAPQPHGKYWQKGMKIGYQDQGGWTIPITTKGKTLAASWLWAQFCVSKTVDVEKMIAGNTPIRKSCVNSDWATKNEAKFGGIITFFRSPMYKWYTPTGPNVPDYQLLQEQMWHFIAPAISGEKNVEQCMNELAAQEDMLLRNLYLPEYSPKLNPEKGADFWLDKKQNPGAPWPEIAGDEKPRTMGYDEMLKRWRAGEFIY